MLNLPRYVAEGSTREGSSPQYSGEDTLPKSFRSLSYVANDRVVCSMSSRWPSATFCTLAKDLCTVPSMSTIQSPVTDEIHPDVALVARAKEGDGAAFEKLVRQYERQVFRVAQHITQNREDAEDITQDAFLKAYEKLDQFQGNSKFSTWLIRIAVNESLMRLRKRKTNKTVSMDQDLQTEDGAIPRDFAEWRPNPEQTFGQSELGDILRRTIQGLPPGFRTVFTLRDIENLSTEETAEALGLSVSTLR